MKKMKFISAIAAVFAVLFALSLVVASAAYYGDVDRNGKVNSSDARTILRHSAKLSVITDEEILKIADITGDGRVNSSDARAALRMAGKLDPLKEIPEEPTTEEPSSDVTETTTPDPVPPVTTTEPDAPATTAPAPATTEPPVTEAPIVIGPSGGDVPSVDIGDL